MVSSTLCPAVHILGSQNVYGRAEGIADHYWPCAVFFKILKFSSLPQPLPLSLPLPLPLLLPLYLNLFLLPVH